MQNLASAAGEFQDDINAAKVYAKNRPNLLFPAMAAETEATI